MDTSSRQSRNVYNATSANSLDFTCCEVHKASNGGCLVRSKYGTGCRSDSDAAEVSANQPAIEAHVRTEDGSSRRGPCTTNLRADRTQ